MRVPTLPFSLSVAYIASLFTALHDNCDSSSDMMVYEKKRIIFKRVANVVFNYECLTFNFFL